jgi:hypothetical protein
VGTERRGVTEEKQNMDVEFVEMVYELHCVAGTLVINPLKPKLV